MVLDPEVVSQLLVRRRRDDPLRELTPREQDVLALMAEGRSNTNIARTIGGERRCGGEARPQHLHQARAAAQRPTGNRRGIASRPPDPLIDVFARF